MSAWEVVLIEWCNCLDISKKIQDFNELRNGDFFKNILCIINKSDEFTNDTNIFKILLHILSQIYNNAQIEYSQYNSFLELSDDDLKIITSLLMHYTCIYDRRDILTSPLCHRLSKNTQVCIRSFLQKVDNEINYEDLEIIIKELSVSDNENSFTNNDKFHSPLMGILKTPVSKASRFHEKDRELTKLKNMLELERYEKADLLEELRQQSEKIKKFESALNNSNSDIIRLKTKISALESRTPPHFQTTDLTDKEKRLKMDIQSLEHYIEKTEKEQEDLREEAYNSRKKLKEWEVEYSNLHRKYLEFENKVEDLTKLSVNQTNRISTLEAYCDELNGLLEEYKTKSTNESCVLEASTLNVRRSLTVEEETLACSVVEVQLKDAQNENRELMMKIELLNMQLDHDKKMMETRMNEYVARYNKLLEYTTRFTDMKTDIVDLQIVYEKEMNEFSSCIEEIKQTFISVVVGSYENSIKNLSIELTKEKERSQLLSVELAASISSFAECNKSLEDTLNEKSICQENIAQLEKVVADLNETIQELSSNLNISEDCNKKYLAKLDTLQEENVKYKNEIDQQKEISQSLSDELSASVLNFEECNKDLERTLNEKNICLGNFAKLEKMVDDLNKKINELSSNLNTSEDCNKKYSVKIDTLQEENVKYKNELDQQKEISQSLSDKLSASILNVEQCSKELEKTLNEKNICEDNFAQLQKVVDDLNKKIHELSSNLNTSEDCNEKYSAKIDTLQEENVKYKNKLDQQKEISQSLSDKLSASILNVEQCSKELEKTLNEKNICEDNFAQLQKVVDDLNKKIHELSSNLNTSEDCNKKYSVKIDTLQEENVKYKNELDQQKEISQSLSDKLSASILNVEQCSKELEKTLNEKNICEDNFAQLQKVVDDLNKKIHELSLNLNTSEDCSKKYSVKIDTLQEENVKYKNELDQQKEVSQSLSYKLSAAILNVEQCNKELEKSLNEKNICEENFAQLQKVVDDLNKKIHELSLNLNTSEDCNKKYSVKIDTLQEENVKYKKELDQQKEISQSLSDKLSASLLNFEECNKDLERTLNEKNICLDNFAKLEKLVDDLNKKINELSSNLNTSEHCNKKYLVKIDGLEEENVKYKNELDQQKEISQSLSDELSALILNVDQCKKELEKTLNEKNICEDNFYQLKKVVDDLNKKIQELTSNLNNSEDCNEKYSAKIDTLQEENVKYKNKLDQQKEISQSLSDKLSASILNVDQFKKELEKTLNEKNICEENFAELQKVVDDLNKKIHELSLNLNTSEDCNKKYSVKIDTLQEENVKYKNELNQQKEISQSLSDKLSASILNVEQCSKELENSLNEKNICEDNFAQLQKVVDDLNKKIHELSSNLNTSEDCNKKYSVKIDTLQEENVKYKNDLDQQEEMSRSLASELAASVLNFEECNKNLEKTLNEKNICQDKFAQLEKVVDDLYKKIQELSSNLDTAEECNKEYLTKIDILEEQNVKYKYELDQLENEKETQLLELSSENEEKDKLMNEKKNLEEDYINLVTTIAMYNEELNKVVQSLKKQSVAEISDFPNSFYPLNLSSEFNSPEKSMKGDNLDELNRLGEQISKINSYIHLYSEKESFYRKEIDNLKGELATSSTNYFDLAENLKEQNSDNESLITSLTENLHNIIEKYNHLQVEHLEQLNRLKEYEVEITKLKKIHSDITLTNQLKITNLQDEILKFEEEILSTKKINDNMAEAYENKIKLLEDNLAGSNENVNFLKAEIKRLNDEYNVKVNALEMKITLLKEEKVNLLKTLQHLRIENESEIDNLQINILNKEKLITSLKEQCKDNEAKIGTMQVQMAMVKEELSQVKNRSGKTEEEYQSSLANLQVQVVASKLEITKLSAKIDVLIVEKDECKKQLKALEEERNKEIHARTTLSYELEKERELNEQLRNEMSEKNVLLSKEAQYTELQGKYEKLQQESLNQKFLEEKQIELQQKIETLMKSNEVQKETYEVFKIYFKEFRDKFDKLISQKSILERITNNLRVLVVSMNKNIPIESVHLKTLFEKKEAMEVIAEDIMKQYNRCSKQMNDIVFDILSYYEKTCDDLLSTLDIQIQNYSEKYNLEELDIQISDLSERTADALEQVKVLQKDLENLGKMDNLKVQKENILGASRQINVDKMKEDEMKKKNLMLRQKVTLLENAKSNLEKTVKKLRDENKKIKEGCDKTAPTNDAHYNMLLQEYVAFKDKHNDILKEYKTKLEQLQKEYEEHKEGCMRTSTPLGNEPDLPSEAEKYLMADLNNLREAYSSIRAIKAKLETENLYSKKLIEEQKEEISKFNFMKEAYDKLLEENSKLMTDVDTMKYKRTRDRDEFLRLLRKERSESDIKNSKQLQEIKNDYEGKLEKMKEKMIKLYREEVNKEMSKVKAGQHESTTLLKIIEQLKGDLFEAEQKVQVIEAERDMLRKSRDQANLRGSRESFSSLQLHDSDTRSLRDFPASSAVSSSRALSSSSRPSIEFKHPSAKDARRQSEVRRVSTLPRTGTVVEEVTLTRRTSFGVTDSIGPNLHMEDEEEMFNNKYLADLKQGKCDLPASDDRESRVSELAWRNSLVPPHLKSSYPAEMQFCSPGRFKDDDIKTGNLPFDDSLSKLLPGEKPRKKDFGTTSYKKPGPPTPSKNGGRLSLQGNEVHPAREPPTEPKKSTPGRIRALFTGKNSSRSSTEVSPQKRRLNIFRR